MSGPVGGPGSLDALQRRLGHRFSQPALLERALTHRSVGPEHNERLEFLGDAALGLAMSSLLFERWHEGDEGELTRARAHLVREESLHAAALALGLPQFIRLSEAEARGGGAQRASILADAVEAVLGAVLLDDGFDAVSRVVVALFGDRLHESDAARARKDAKTALQELLQSRRHPLPAYRIVATTGREHEQLFEVACEVASADMRTVAHGRSRRAAEQAAAGLMLRELQARPQRLAHRAGASPAEVPVRGETL